MKNILRFLFVLFCLSTVTNSLHAQWIQTNGPYGGKFMSLAVDGSNIFAAGGVLFRSTDNGNNWIHINEDLPEFSSIVSFAKIGTNLFAGGYGGGVFLSTDDGVNWTTVTNQSIK